MQHTGEVIEPKEIKVVKEAEKIENDRKRCVQDALTVENFPTKGTAGAFQRMN